MLTSTSTPICLCVYVCVRVCVCVWGGGEGGESTWSLSEYMLASTGTSASLSKRRRRCCIMSMQTLELAGKTKSSATLMHERRFRTCGAQDNWVI